MELDTGATISVISEYEWKKLFPQTSIVTPYVGKPLCGYSGQQLEKAGQATVQVTYKKQKADLPLVIVAGDYRPALFGQNWLAIIKLNWAELHRIQSDKLQEILEKHSVLFEQGMGTINGYKADMRLRPDTKPIFKKANQ